VIKKKVMIVGGGVAGMEAARVAALRGHKVVIYEKTKQLGGQIRIAGKAPGKEKILWFYEYLTAQLRKLEVKIELGVDVSIDVIDAANPDVVIVATGAEPTIPDIPGIEGENRVTAWDVLSGKIDVANQEIIVIGGGMVGCEAAEFMVRRDNQVTVVEMKPTMASDMEPNNRAGLMESLRDAKVHMLTDTEIVEIRKDGVIGKRRDTEKHHFVKGDLVVFAVGAKPQRDLAEALEEKEVEVYTTGDCNEPRGIMNAVYEGSLIARNI
jgi:pyruvate/2-oxoglutarate dehydrogenase complex dihydrolipoamide dehydrogenase (E3) component